MSYDNLFKADTLLNGFATLVGALAGAMVAYLFQRRLQRLQEAKVAVLAGHRLMFALLQQINTIVLMQRDYVFPHRSNGGRFLAIPALPPFDLKKNLIELTDVAFLLDDRPGRALLYEFIIAQDNYTEALTQWNLRSAFHLEQLQPAIAASGIPNGSKVSDEAMRKALGDQIYFRARGATANCEEMLRRAFQKLAAVKDAARPYLVGRFKSSDFTDFDFPDTWGLDTPVPQRAQDGYPLPASGS